MDRGSDRRSLCPDLSFPCRMNQREAKVKKLLERGHSVSEIARKLGYMGTMLNEGVLFVQEVIDKYNLSDIMPL